MPSNKTRPAFAGLVTFALGRRRAERLLSGGEGKKPAPTTPQYNRRRLLTSEQMNWNTIALAVTYGYNN
jgi:hypothetical protein